MPRSPCTLAIGWLCLCDWEVKKSHVGVDGQEVILCVTYKYVTLQYVTYTDRQSSFCGYLDSCLENLNTNVYESYSHLTTIAAPK